MAIRTVIQADNPILKGTNQPILNFISPKIQQVIQDMTDTMYDAGLIGIAAPQIAENYYIFVTHVRNTSSRNLGKEDILRVYINPLLTYLSEETVTIYEGCGSINESGDFGPVERPKEIAVEAYDAHGTKFSLRCDGLLARVILHECDHLQGIEFIERMKVGSQLISAESYRKNIKLSPEQIAASLITKIE